MGLAANLTNRLAAHNAGELSHTSGSDSQIHQGGKRCAERRRFPRTIEFVARHIISLSERQVNTLDVRTRPAWRRWLAKHHATVTAVWLVFHKTHTGVPAIPYDAAVEEALCFGWVDSLITRLDEDRYARKFTPRKPDSQWSASNRRRYATLQAAGLLAAAGRRRRPTAGSPAAPPPVVSAPAYIAKALKARPRAWTAFQALAPSHRRLYLTWIHSAKRDETRQRRLREAIRRLLRGETLGLQ